ncbi:MAG: RNA-directed DNA polymerase [Alcaligenaceae bacterium]|nr:MAG: RNA-directed DNA polymerase [Alcaligenaceae bacterium]
MDYQTFRIAKGSGKFRTIYKPSQKDKLQLKSLLPILEDLLKNLTSKQSSSYAFEKGKNCALNALQHIGYKYTLSMDMCDFFDSINTTHLTGILPAALLNCCLIDGCLRQGLPTSPIISSIAFHKYDCKIQDALNLLKIEAVYTRYADDLVFSFDDIHSAGKIKAIVNQIVGDGGFSINHTKTKLQDIRNGRIVITGIAVDRAGLHPTRRTMKKLRAARHQANARSIAGLTNWSKCRLPNI